MTRMLPGLFAFLAAHPVLALALAAGAVGAAWGLHIGRLRRSERHLAMLVDERTRLWQEEVSAHAKLRALMVPPAAADAAAASDGARVSRVLVVGDRRERRAAMSAVFDELGIEPAFADSQWAATVAASQADAEGAPYDLILIDPSMEGVESDQAPAQIAAAS